jgi:exosortase
MQRVVVERRHYPRTGQSPSLQHWSARTIAALVLLAALWFLLCRELSGEWSVNEQYSYGWFVPFFALYLFWLRWQDRPEPSPRRKTSLLWIFIGVPVLLLLLPIRLFEIANPEWRPLGWIHAASVTTLTLLYIWYAGGSPWLRHFAFPILFAFIAVPWVTPIEVPIVQGLMRAVAAVASEAATLFGIPTQPEGNLIRIPNGVVGMNEACSGVRSLQTALMIGLLVGELKRLSILHRVALVAGAIAIAFIGNCVRAFFLVWIAATKNIAAIDRWHDVAGYSIVAAVFAGSLLLAILLSRKKTKSQDEKPEGAFPVASTSRSSSFVLPISYFLSVLCWIVVLEVGAHLWYRAHERNLLATARWDVQWPETAPNFRKLTIDEDVRRTLRFDQGRAAAWTWPAANSPDTPRPLNSKTITCLFYLFRWNPGRNSAILASSHRPEVCLPAFGWRRVADTGVRSYPTANSFALPFRHFEFRRRGPENSAQLVADVFYCLSEDRAPAPEVKLPQMAAPRLRLTRNERIRQVLEGRRHLGQQMMEVIFISNAQIPAADAESRLADLAHNIVVTKPSSR